MRGRQPQIEHIVECTLNTVGDCNCSVLQARARAERHPAFPAAVIIETDCRDLLIQLPRGGAAAQDEHGLADGDVRHGAPLRQFSF